MLFAAGQPLRGSPIRRYRYELGTHQTQALQTDCNHSHPAGRCDGKRGRCRLHAALGGAAGPFCVRCAAERPYAVFCWVPRPAPPRLFCLQRTSGLPFSCRSCAAGTPPDNTPTPIRCDTYNCSKPRTLFGRAGLAAKKALCYNEENEPRM